MTAETLYVLVGFIGGFASLALAGLIFLSITLRKRDTTIQQKDKIIEEFSQTVVPLLREMLKFQKSYADQQADRDNQLRVSIDRFGDIVSKLVTVFTALDFFKDVPKKQEKNE